MKRVFASALALVLLVSGTAAAETEETRLCVIVRSEGPLEGDLLAAVAAGTASITVEAPEACAPDVLEVGETSGAAAGELAALRVAPEVPEGYERKRFKHWVDADGDGCDTREEVLIEESLTEVRVRSGCDIRDGSWRSAYDDRETTEASSFDIDHVVPLAEAWRSGAWAWTDERRQRFANDLDDERALRAVTASSNRSKGGRDPAQWMPPDIDFHCQYAQDWVAIKERWDLAVDEDERAALADTLAAC